MSTTQIGRAGAGIPLGDTAKADWGGGAITVSGRARCASLDDLTALRLQLQGLEGNIDEPVVPVILEDVPAGFWSVSRVSWSEDEGAYDGLFTATWSVDLVSVRSRSEPLIEARLLMTDPPAFGGAATPWTSVPATASGWSTQPPQSTGTVTVRSRVSASGEVRIYTGAYLDDIRTWWLQSPASFYDAAATVQEGVNFDDDPSGGAGSVTFTPDFATQSYVVPAGVTTVRVFAAGGDGGNSTAYYGVAHGTGGRGATVACDLAVTPGETLNVMVGQAGRAGGIARVGDSGVGKGGAGGAVGPTGFNFGRGGAGGEPVREGASYPYAVIGGAGGGSASSIARAYADVSDVLVVAGGGGGAAGVNGGASNVNGRPGSGAVYAGQGGTQLGGGAGGTGIFGSGAAGDDPTGTNLGNGGAGHTATGSGKIRSGGGGGGGGFAGGGGAYAGGGPTEFAASGGGGGSSLTTGVNSIVDTKRTGDANGWVIIAPLTATSGDTFPTVTSYRTIVGRQRNLGAFGWRLANDVIRVRPIYSATEAGFAVEVFNGDEWGTPQVFRLFDYGTSAYTSPGARLSAWSILRNSAEASTIRCTYDTSGTLNSHTLDLTLRRGASFVTAKWSSSYSTVWAVRVNPTAAATAFAGTGGMTATTADGDGNKWMLSSPDAFTDDLTNGGLRATSAGFVLRFAAGMTIPSDPTSVQNESLIQGGETARIVAQ